MFRRARTTTIRDWPVVESLGGQVPGEVKAPTVADIERLSTVAAQSHWSATGRSRWLQKSSSEIEMLTLAVHNLDEPKVYRCIVTAFCADGTASTFTLDVGSGDFDKLPSMPLDELVILARRMLFAFPMLEMHAGQQESGMRGGDSGQR